MLTMASSGFAFPQVAKHFPESPLWQTLGHQFQHLPWGGCTFWDMIQPSFMFMVGVALPFSYASRRAQGQSWSQLFGHALLRSLVLIALAVFLSSTGSKTTQTNFIFTNVLAQIGLGYMVVFLLVGRSPRVQLATALAILAGYWLLFAAYPLPSPGFDRKALGIPENVPALPGFFAHWDMNTNAAAAFDRWFLNLFPRPANDPFRFNEGGYATLNFIPSIATMIFGLLAGELVRSERSGAGEARDAGAGRGPLPGGRHRARRHRLPGRQADLDPLVDDLQHGLGPLATGVLLRGGRRGGLSPLDVPAGRGRRQLDRHVRDVAALEAVHREHVAGPLRHVLDGAGHHAGRRPAGLRAHRHAPRPPPVRRPLRSHLPVVRGPFCPLAGLLLDVPAADLREDLSGLGVVMIGEKPPRKL